MGKKERSERGQKRQKRCGRSRGEKVNGKDKKKNRKCMCHLQMALPFPEFPTTH